jgi:hypothetical protein
MTARAIPPPPPGSVPVTDRRAAPPPPRGAVPVSASRPAPRPAAPKKEGWGDSFGNFENAVGRGFTALPGSALNAVKGVASVVRHPLKTLDHVSDVIAGGAEAGIERGVNNHFTRPGHRLRMPNTPERRAFGDTVQGYKDRYGSLDRVGKTLQTDPVGAALDASVVAGGVGGLVRRTGLLKAGGRAAAGGAVRRTLKPLEEKVSPGTVDAHARQQAPIQRRVLAKHRLDAERSSATLERHQKVLGNASVGSQRAVINAVESASRGGIARLPAHLQPAAVAVRDVAQRYRARIEDVMKANGSSGPKFVEDYYARMWKQKPQEVSAAMSRQGSSRNLRGRTIPTYQEGLAAGLKPIHENPLDGMTAYVDNMSRFLATHELQTEMRVNGLAKWHFKGKLPPGWVALDGINTERELKPITKDIEGLPVHTGNVPPRVLAAPEGAARLYNNYVNTGINDPLFKGVEKAFNAQAGLKLAGSLFHPVLVGGKALASDTGNALNHFLRGQVGDGLKSLGHAPLAPITTAYEGGKMGDRLLAGDSAMNDTDRLFVEAGGRVTGDQIYRSSQRPNLLKSGLRGTLLRDVKDGMKATVKGPLKERVAAIADLGARVFDTLQAPTFQHYVPAVKRGVFEREMRQILARDPAMSEATKAAEARALLDNIDGRMGEMVRDNNFWSQSQMQVAKLMFLSPSWQLGDVRILGDAIKGLPESAKGLVKGKGLTNGTAQAAGLVGSYFLMNGLANYLYTGSAPEGEDWAHFRTGAENADGTPERAAVPSVMKDFFGAVNGPMQEFINKLHPSLKMGYELANNSDWKGDPIVKPSHATIDPEASRFAELLGYLGEQFKPIGFNDNPNGPNSGIGTAGKVLGLRPSGMAYTNPDKLEGVLRYKDNTAWQRKQMHDRKTAAKQEPRAPQGEAPPPPAGSTPVDDVPPPPEGSTPIADEGDIYTDIQRQIPGIDVTSGFRTPEYQADMKRRGYRPASDSGHLSGSKLDLVPPKGMSRAQLRAKIKALYPNAHILDEGDHLDVAFPGYFGAPALGGAHGLRNPNQGIPPPPPGSTPVSD